MRKNNNTTFNGDLLGIEPRVEPVIYSGIEPTKGVFYFDDAFTKESIIGLINDIEQFRQGGYTGLDLYFQSNGGDVDYLFTLADYINTLPEGFDLTILPNGMCASAGFYIMLMVERANIVFLKPAYGMIHLASCYINSYALYNNDKTTHDYSKFRLDNIKELNDFIKEEYIKNLDVAEDDLKQILEGKELYFSNEEFEKVVISYANKKYFKSDGFKAHIEQLESQADNIDLAIISALDAYEKEIGEPFYEVGEEADLDSEEVVE
jgi:ATP-dependent protease ClpP protease subunit